jgi:hypothetical protein
MGEQHPITPPPELVQEAWAVFNFNKKAFLDVRQAWEVSFAVAYQAGADQRGAATEAELQEARDEEREACCKWLTEQTCFHPNSDLIKDLRAARRPKPPTLKEQALELLGHSQEGWGLAAIDFDTIRRALEALPK